MSIEMYESTMKRLNIFRELELSEKQIEAGSHTIRHFGYYIVGNQKLNFHTFIKIIIFPVVSINV